MVTIKEIAAEIVGQMSPPDRTGLTKDGWKEGVGSMLQGDWEGADLDEVLGEVQAQVGQ